jgi:signal transduction histidine kinase/DNA-binding response OmpR family regulator
MKKILLFILLFIPVLVHAQDDKDVSELSYLEIHKLIQTEIRSLKTAEDRKDKAGMGKSLGSIGECYLAVGKKISKGAVQNEAREKEKKQNLDLAIDFLNKSVTASEEAGDIEQLKASYKNLSAAQKLNGDIKAAMSNYKKMLALKKTIFNSKKVNDIEKKQIEYIHDKREDSIRQKQLLAEEHLKEQTRILAQQQRALDSAKNTLNVSEQEKTKVSLALKKSQTDLNFEKQSLQDKEKKLTLAEEERALQATDLQLKQSKLELQQSELQLQQSKVELQQNALKLQQDELHNKDKVLGQQRIYLAIGLLGILIMAGFSFFIVRERKKAIQQKLRAERSEQFKQQFLANISHEIRTPMNAINGMVGLLLQKNPRTEQESYLKAIAKSSDILLHVINDVLDISKIEAGKLELEAIDFSLSDTIKQVKDTLAYRAEDKGLQLITRIDDNLEDVLVGDPYRLNQILINLGGNALKFTEKGGVHIDLDLEKKEADNVFVKFSISDTGIGIPANKISSLFANFSQVSSSDTRKYGGTGLGLSISKHLVELQGGTISVESTLGSGTTFSFIIKYPIGSEKRLHDRIAAETNVDGSVLNGLRILIADDNEYNRLVVDETLHLMSDLFTEQVVNGQEVIDMMMKNDYHAILMDVQMPVMNGIDATKHIRAHLTGDKRNIPIVALTASVLRSDLDLCFQSGMNAYVPKPFKPWQLVNTIAEATGREHLKGNGKAPASTEKRTSKEATKKELSASEPIIIDRSDEDNYVYVEKITDLEYLRKFCDGDEKKMNKYIKVYLNALPVFYKNIDTAVENKDFVEVALHVHSFKPKFMMMGMKQTNELGIKIDHLCKSKNDKAFDHLKNLLEEVKKSAVELDVVS